MIFVLEAVHITYFGSCPKDRAERRGIRGYLRTREPQVQYAKTGRVDLS